LLFGIHRVSDGSNQYVAVCCSVLQCVAGRCSVLQCVAVCCSVLHPPEFITKSLLESIGSPIGRTRPLDTSGYRPRLTHSSTNSKEHLINERVFMRSKSRHQGSFGGRWRVLQGVAGCCSVLQCVAVSHHRGSSGAVQFGCSICEVDNTRQGERERVCEKDRKKRRY